MAEEKKAKARKPVVAIYCATFLAEDMRHIYRQVTGLRIFQQHVITKKRRNAEAFPVHKKWIIELPRPNLRFFRRLWYKSIKGSNVPMSTREVRDALYAFQRHDAQLMHIYFGNIAVDLLPLMRTMIWPVVVSFHGADAGVDTEKPNYCEQLKEVFERATLVMARSHSLLERLIELGCPEEKLRLQRTGIPLDEVPRIDRTPPADGAWRFFQACRLVEKKGLPVSLRAFKTVRKKFPKARFVIAGSGPLEESLKSKCRELGIADAVDFRGFLQMSDLVKEMHAAHVFLHPSETPKDGNREGVPNSMLEAMGTGLPAVATTHGGIPEVISHGENGLLSEEGDVEGLTENLLKLTDDADLYQRLAEASYKTVLEKFSANAQIAILEGHYREAVETFPKR